MQAAERLLRFQRARAIFRLGRAPRPVFVLSFHSTWAAGSFSIALPARVLWLLLRTQQFPSRDREGAVQRECAALPYWPEPLQMNNHVMTKLFCVRCHEFHFVFIGA